jgi:hypothetical protein
MFCKSCGKQIDNDSIFCTYCGTRQSTDFKPHPAPDSNKLSEQSGITNQTTYKRESDFNNSAHVTGIVKYDPTYKKNDDAMTLGIVLLIIGLIIAIVGPIQFEDKESYGTFKAITAVISLILRVIITVWVVNIAKEQNRETLGWGLFAFFLPSIALIVISTRKKLFANIQIVNALDNEQNSKILSDKARQFYSDKKYAESIRFSEKAAELNPTNEDAHDILKKCKIAFIEKDNENKSTQTVLRETTDGNLLKIVSQQNRTIGADVFIDDIPSPNGVYTYKSGTHKLVVENGKIKERYFITRYKNLVVHQVSEDKLTQGDFVYLENGQTAPSGEYSTGFMAAKLVVENGKFIKLK